MAKTRKRITVKGTLFGDVAWLDKKKKGKPPAPEMPPWWSEYVTTTIAEATGLRVQALDRDECRGQ
jgi:hypothetical protein